MHSIKKSMLYAPTYRGDADKAYIPEKLDIKALKENFRQRVGASCKKTRLC